MVKSSVGELSFDESHALFRGAFSLGFPWEVLKVMINYQHHDQHDHGHDNPDQGIQHNNDNPDQGFQRASQRGLHLASLGPPRGGLPRPPGQLHHLIFMQRKTVQYVRNKILFMAAFQAFIFIFVNVHFLCDISYGR